MLAGQTRESTQPFYMCVCKWCESVSFNAQAGLGFLQQSHFTNKETEDQVYNVKF